MNNATAETRQQRRFKQRQDRKGARAPAKNAFYRVMAIVNQRAEALKAAMMIGPIAAKLALMDLALKLGEYKSRGHGRGTPTRNHLRSINSRRPHQGAQECARRAVGGWARHYKRTGWTKEQALQIGGFA